MQVATAPATAAQASFTVCYSCAYQSTGQSGGPGSVCPRCSFPLITCSEMSPAGGIRLSDVLHRESIRVGAPPLPGVHAEKREAQALAEARRALHSQADPPSQVVTAELATDATGGSAMWNLVCVSLLAVGIGVAAAVMQSAL